MIHFHKWSKWAITHAMVYPKGAARRVTLQYRTCSKCHKTQTSYV